MVAYLHGMEGVESSNLFRSTISILASRWIAQGEARIMDSGQKR